MPNPYQRVLPGSLLAGVVINPVGYVLGPLLFREGEIVHVLASARPIEL